MMNVASYIDHTLLKPTTRPADIKKLCSEALQYEFAAVCVPPPYIKLAKQELKASNAKVATVIGFPFGYSITAAKLKEVEQALEDGADELDVVHNISAVKSGAWQEVKHEMERIIQPVHLNNSIIKVIIESGVLTDEEITRCCMLYGSLGADFVKTSTGYAETGASIKAVQLMRVNLPSGIRIKASGGIRTYESAIQFIKAGADRIGTSSGTTIVKEQSAVQ